eukprot:snap_masked-scaffold_73-processed-gene-0.25-mRNA-1 protein AED:1.00 eAED:1.00 QI:0/0/0/0/1/1/2/0/85
MVGQILRFRSTSLLDMYNTKIGVIQNGPKKFENMAIMIKRSESLTLTAFSDAAFADCLEDKFKSSSGFFILLGSVPIVWKAKKLK